MAFHAGQFPARSQAAFLTLLLVGSVSLACDSKDDADGLTAMVLLLLVVPAVLGGLVVSLPVVAILYVKRRLSVGGAVGFGVLLAFIGALVIGTSIGGARAGVVLGAFAAFLAVVVILVLSLFANTDKVPASDGWKKPKTAAEKYGTRHPD